MGDAPAAAAGLPVGPRDDGGATLPCSPAQLRLPCWHAAARMRNGRLAALPLGSQVPPSTLGMLRSCSQACGPARPACCSWARQSTLAVIRVCICSAIMTTRRCCRVAAAAAAAGAGGAQPGVRCALRPEAQEWRALHHAPGGGGCWPWSCGCGALVVADAWARSVGDVWAGSALCAALCSCVNWLLLSRLIAWLAVPRAAGHPHPG